MEKKFVRYAEGAKMYSMGLTKFFGTSKRSKDLLQNWTDGSGQHRNS